jgi:hypothetical protein
MYSTAEKVNKGFKVKVRSVDKKVTFTWGGLSLPPYPHHQLSKHLYPSFLLS